MPACPECNYPEFNKAHQDHEKEYQCRNCKTFLNESEIKLGPNEVTKNLP